jgi:kynurenine formamidase
VTTLENQGNDFPDNWGRWGPDDNLGTLNFITDEVRARAVREARVGRTVSLAIPITPAPFAAGPVPFTTTPTPSPILMMMNFTGSPPMALTEVLVINTHHVALTHIDALVHMPRDGEVYPGVPLAEAIHWGTATRGSTTSFADGIVTRGVLLDLAPGGRVESGSTVSREDLEAAEERSGVTVASGDALVVRGGWTVHEHIGQPLPAMSVDAVRWIAEREVSVFAGDIGDRPPPDRSVPMAMHHGGLARLGLPLIDGAEVEPLAGACTELKRWTFLFTLGPMAVCGATGIPVNPLAIF